MKWAEKYVSIQFRQDGRDRAGCDCWGLYRLILLERKGIELPLHPEQTSLSQARRITEESESPLWKKLEPGQEQELDCILMRGQFMHEGRLRSRPIHIGCVLGQGLLIHTEVGAGTTIVSYAQSPMIRNRVVGFYRYDPESFRSSET